MPHNPQSIQTILLNFTHTLGSPSPSLSPSQLSQLTKIKQIILFNPNNYYHPVYSKLDFQTLYEFVIDCLSFQHQQAVFNVLVHVLALMVRFWVLDCQHLKQIFQGILALVQQRSYCGENCFLFFSVLVQTMQEYGQNLSINGNNNAKEQFSRIPTSRSTLENYFIYHLLNELLAFANIFLDRSVVRNQRLQDSNDPEINRQQIPSRSRMSQCLDRAPLSPSPLDQSQISSFSQNQPQLYTLMQPESTLLAILKLVHQCLSYDFCHTSRHNQQSEYETQKSPIILPTKYSKYCKFGEYDIFIKDQDTSDMLNYLFFICGTNVKKCCVSILKAMIRVHFRYFKNKATHIKFLRDVACVVQNLLTGLDLNSPMIASINGSLHTTRVDKHSKVEIAVSLGQAVSLLLYHQPTFYFLEQSIIQQLIQRIQTFILDEIFDPDNFNINRQFYSSKNENKSYPEDSYQKMVNQTLPLSELCLLMEAYIAELYKLGDFCKSYLNNNQQILQIVNQVNIKIGERLFSLLCLHCGHRDRNKVNIKNIQKQKFNNLNEVQDWNAQKIIKVQKSQAGIFYMNQFQRSIHEKNEEDQPQQKIYKQETNINLLQIDISKSEKSQKIKEISNLRPLEAERQDRPGSGSKEDYEKQKLEELQYDVCFLMNLFQEDGDVQNIRCVLSAFRIYCPKYCYFDTLNPKITQNPTSSNLSYSSTEPQPQRTLISNKPPPSPQFWLTSWLCNFENHFYITSGLSKNAAQWQIILHQQMIVQLIQDLQQAIKLCIGSNTQYENVNKADNQLPENQKINKNQNENENERDVWRQMKKERGWMRQLSWCVNLIIIYVVDKCVGECRIPVQEYLQCIKVDIFILTQWVCHQLLQYNHKNTPNQLMPVIQLINSINLYSFLQTSNNQPNLTGVHLNRCLPIAIKYFQSVLVFLHKQYQINDLVIKMEYVLLKQVTQLQCLTRFQYEPLSRSSLLSMLSELFFISPYHLRYHLEILISDMQMHWHRKQIFQIYQLIRDQCLRFYAQRESNSQYFYILHEKVRESVKWRQMIDGVGALGLIVQTQRKLGISIDKKIKILRIGLTYITIFTEHLTNQTHSATNTSNKHPQQSLLCQQYIPYILSLSSQLTLLPPTSLPESSQLQIQNKLLHLVQNILSHLDCLQYQNIDILLVVVRNLVNVVHFFLHVGCNGGNAMWKENANDNREFQRFLNKENEERVKVVINVVEGLLYFVGKINQIYSNEKVAKLQETVMDLILSGYTANAAYNGILQTLLHLSHYNPAYTSSLSNTISIIIVYLYKKCKQSLPFSPSPAETSPSPSPQTYLKVDNMVEVFTQYHPVFQKLYNDFGQNGLHGVDNQIFCNCVKYLKQYGVAWVIRKLEEWGPQEVKEQAKQQELKKNQEYEFLQQKHHRYYGEGSRPLQQQIQGRESYKIQQLNRDKQQEKCKNIEQNKLCEAQIQAKKTNSLGSYQKNEQSDKNGERSNGADMNQTSSFKQQIYSETKKQQREIQQLNKINQYNNQLYTRSAQPIIINQNGKWEQKYEQKCKQNPHHTQNQTQDIQYKQSNDELESADSKEQKNNNETNQNQNQNQMQKQNENENENENEKQT